VELIFETWRAHLLKARTWALDVEGNRIGSVLAADQLEERDVFKLSKLDRAEYFSKQNNMSRLGVTALLASVMASLSSRHCRLTDSATMLFIELLNGGNATVQVDIDDDDDDKEMGAAIAVNLCCAHVFLL
jgi:hypothetical protein